MVADGKMGGGGSKVKIDDDAARGEHFIQQRNLYEEEEEEEGGKTVGVGRLKGFFFFLSPLFLFFPFPVCYKGRLSSLLTALWHVPPPILSLPPLPRRIHFRTIWVQLIRPHLINKRSSPLSTYCSPCQHITPLPDTHTHTHTETLTPSTWAQPPRRAPWLKEPES